MLEIKSGEYTLYCDGMNYYITKSYIDSKGKLKEKNITGYYGKVEQVLKDFIHKRTAKSDENFKTISKYLKSIKDAQKDAEALLQAYTDRLKEGGFIEKDFKTTISRKK